FWRRQMWVLAVTPLVAWLGVVFVQRSTLPRPPLIATSGFEPATAAQIEQALAEVRRSSRSGRTWGKLGMVLQAHELASARFCFEQAERFEPTEPRWPYLHGLLSMSENSSVAIAKLERASDLCREQPDAARLQLAQSLFVAGRLDEAEGNFKRLLRANPKH